MPSQQPSRTSELNELSSGLSRPGKPEEPPAKPIVVHFKAVLQGLAIGASLLPSLQAQYRVSGVLGAGKDKGVLAHYRVFWDEEVCHL